MGFAFFEQDGTFNPADYGLKVGDMIAVVMIGGGGSSVNAGTASSFGDYLTAAGGAAAGSSSYAGDGGWHPSLPMTMCKALPNTYNSDTAVFSNAGGLRTSSGSIPIIMYGGGVGQQVNLTNNTSGWAYGTNGNWFGKGGKGSSAYGRGEQTLTATIMAAGGGSGYGAGGAGGRGHYYWASNRDPSYNIRNGGGAGELITSTIKLDNLDIISIIVGKGGAGAEESSHTYCKLISGAGENGCVAVYW